MLRYSHLLEHEVVAEVLRVARPHEVEVVEGVVAHLPAEDEVGQLGGQALDVLRSGQLVLVGVEEGDRRRDVPQRVVGRLRPAVAAAVLQRPEVELSPSAALDQLTVVRQLACRRAGRSVRLDDRNGRLRNSIKMSLLIPHQSGLNLCKFTELMCGEN